MLKSVEATLGTHDWDCCKQLDLKYYKNAIILLCLAMESLNFTIFWLGFGYLVSGSKLHS